MNIEDRAHEYALELLKTTHANHGYLGEMEIEHIKDTAFALAEAMQAEAEKRKDESSNDFEVDWSQAPDDYIVAWEMISDHQAIWRARDNGYYLAPSFNYQGDWKDSLRKRP